MLYNKMLGITDETINQCSSKIEIGVIITNLKDERDRLTYLVDKSTDIELSSKLLAVLRAIDILYNLALLKKDIIELKEICSKKKKKFRLF